MSGDSAPSGSCCLSSLTSCALPEFYAVAALPPHTPPLPCPLAPKPYCNNRILCQNRFLLICPAGLSDQAQALAFLVEAKSDNPLVQKLAAWVAQGAAPPPLYFAALSSSSSPWESGLRAQALTSYDSSTSSTTPDVQLTIVAAPRGASLPAGNKPGSNKAQGKTNNKAGAAAADGGRVELLSASFTAGNAGRLVSSSTSWAEVPSNASLAFTASGSGEVSVAASLNFTPAELLPFPTYRGLWVQSAVLVEQGGSGSGSSNAAAAAVDGGIGLGKLVTLIAQVCVCVCVVS